MTKIVLQCVAIDDNSSYFTVSLQFSNTTLEISTGGNLNFLIGDASRFEIGKYYSLDLEEVPGPLL